MKALRMPGESPSMLRIAHTGDGMPKVTPTERLLKGWSPAPLPPVAADGGLQLESLPKSLPQVAPIPICELGPCHHYHRVATRMDAQDPLVLAAGEQAQIFVQIGRACYPSPGVEFDITSDPPRECSRWTPMTPAEVAEAEARRFAYAERHADDLQAFQDSWHQTEGETDGTR